MKGSIIYKEQWCREGKSQLPWDAFRNRDIELYSMHNSIALQNIFTVEYVSLYMCDVKVDFFNKVVGSYSNVSLLSSLKKMLLLNACTCSQGMSWGTNFTACPFTSVYSIFGVQLIHPQTIRQTKRAFHSRPDCQVKTKKKSPPSNTNIFQKMAAVKQESI